MINNWLEAVAAALTKVTLKTLKVLTNEKRGGFKVVAFDRSPFKLISLRFSNKSVQAPSCGRPKNTQRTMFLSFEINNCLQITALSRAATPFSHHKLI
jgi:hypothetical protein